MLLSLGDSKNRSNTGEMTADRKIEVNPVVWRLIGIRFRSLFKLYSPIVICSRVSACMCVFLRVFFLWIAALSSADSLTLGRVSVTQIATSSSIYPAHHVADLWHVLDHVADVDQRNLIAAYASNAAHFVGWFQHLQLLPARRWKQQNRVNIFSEQEGMT